MIFSFSEQNLKLATLPTITILDVTGPTKNFIDYRSKIKWFEACIDIFLWEALGPVMPGMLRGYVCCRELANLFQKTKLLGSFKDNSADPTTVGQYKGSDVWYLRNVPDGVGYVMYTHDITKKPGYLKFEIK